MNAVLEPLPQTMTLPPFRAAKEIVYPVAHKEDMGETTIHIKLITMFLSVLELFFLEREDVFVAANLNVYYAQGRPALWFAPDVMIAFGVPKGERRVYKVWEEQVFPQVIIEVASESTWKKDLSEKLKLYSDLGAEEYYALDSEDYLPVPLMAWRREGGRLRPMYLEGDRVFSPRLGLEIVLTGNGFRLFDPDKQEFLPTLQEYEQKLRNSQDEIARLRAELARLQSEG